jgi:hypothetical protein
MFSRICLAFMGRLSAVSAILEHQIEGAVGEPLVAILRAVRVTTALTPDSGSGKLFRQSADRVEPEIALEDVDYGARFALVDHELAVSHIISERHRAAHPNALLLGGRDLVTHALTDQFALELSEREQGRGFATNFSRQRISEIDIDKGLTAYSQDLLEELDRELTDVYPGAKDLLYYFLDAPEVLTAQNLDAILTEAEIDRQEREKVVDFLLYYGVLGTRLGDTDHFIYSVNYDLKVLKIRAQRHQGTADYVVNPAFCPALDIKTAAVAA